MNFLLLFLNKDFLVTSQVTELNFSVHVLRVPLEGILSQNFDLGI